MRFSSLRSRLYREALREFPNARSQDVERMRKYLCPTMGEAILEVGAGSGFISVHIADDIGAFGNLTVSDPSLVQLKEPVLLDRENIRRLGVGAENLHAIPDQSMNAVWSFGALHHVFEKRRAFEHFARVLIPGGRLVVIDVLAGSTLAKHFDDRVARYSVDGHEVAFLSKEYFSSLCAIAGFNIEHVEDLPIEWKFKSHDDIGTFLYKLHGMTKCNKGEVLEGVRKHLRISRRGDTVYLSWPLTVWVAIKR